MTPVGPQPMLRLLGLLPAPTRAEMVRMYGETLLGPLQGVGAALREPIDPDVVALVHKVAGSAAMMQDQDLSLPARGLEHALREGRLADAVALWPQVREAATRTLGALESVSTAR
jgi:HPt (histidine-containing phosphotransfer) domain-containing protein